MKIFIDYLWLNLKAIFMQFKFCFIRVLSMSAPKPKSDIEYLMGTDICTKKVIKCPQTGGGRPPPCPEDS